MGSVAFAVAALFFAGFVGRLVVHDKRPAHPFIAGANAAGEPASTPAPAGDAAAGKSIFVANCAMCHGVTAGAVLVGPTLWGVAGRRIASVPGYDYSAALKAHGAKAWTDAELDPWLKSPAGYAPGTKMYYPGLTDAKNRADVMAFLHTLGPAH